MMIFMIKYIIDIEYIIYIDFQVIGFIYPAHRRNLVNTNIISP